jgi:hypothetical protein
MVVTAGAAVGMWTERRWKWRKRAEMKRRSRPCGPGTWAPHQTTR